MKKRTAEKVIAKSIITLAVYRRKTMDKALRRRKFWSVQKDAAAAEPGENTQSRLRLAFADDKSPTTFTVVYDNPALAESVS